MEPRAQFEYAVPRHRQVIISMVSAHSGLHFDMLAIRTLGEIQQFLEDDFRQVGAEIKLVGFVFAPPQTDVGRELIHCIREFNFRFGCDVHFFFAGWSVGTPPAMRPKDSDEIPPPSGAGEPWYYSASEFNRLVTEIEAACSFKWSGASDILLLPCYKLRDDVKMDYSQSIIFPLNRMLRDESIISVGELLEGISRAGRRTKKADIEQYSDKQGMKVLGGALLNGLMDRLPLQLGTALRKGQYFALHDLSN